MTTVRIPEATARVLLGLLTAVEDLAEPEQLAVRELEHALDGPSLFDTFPEVLDFWQGAFAAQTDERQQVATHNTDTMVIPHLTAMDIDPTCKADLWAVMAGIGLVRHVGVGGLRARSLNTLEYEAIASAASTAAISIGMLVTRAGAQ